MPKRTDIQSILVIGSGPIVIGQACEFDYSGTQAIKALKAEGYRVILVNSNPATIMTDPELADRTYIEPLQPEYIDAILEAEKPDAILGTVGGQTALNLCLELDKLGILKKHGVEMIGVSTEAIRIAEDRELFKAAMDEIGLGSPESRIATSLSQAEQAAQYFGYPVVIRPSFTLGGSGGGIVYNRNELLDIAQQGLTQSMVGQILVERSLIGWKEYELEVIRDAKDQVIIICSIENVDPMGVHTGDSITVAPAQTLTDREYQRLRDASQAILRKVAVDTGGSNVQFAVNPKDGEVVVIEMNPRVSRSSALASKATGFPIAKIAALLSVGYTLDELPNDITGTTPASFEPTIDYVVTKIPRFAFEKFPDADDTLGTQMKSVGEVMAIGRTFKESFFKAMRSLERGPVFAPPRDEDLRPILGRPNQHRIRYLVEALARGWSIDQVHSLTHIDPWFLDQFQQFAELHAQLKGQALDAIDYQTFEQAKRMGFSDRRIALLTDTTPLHVRNRRHTLGLRPVYKMVDTCAAEFASDTPYLYSSYEDEDEAPPQNTRKVAIIGSGPNRIGQGIEFDYCCCHASFALAELDVQSIMINCNPETVSTDYDTSDRLYFEPLNPEDVLEVLDREQPDGVIVQFGGQTPLNLAPVLQQHGIKILGTQPDSIDLAEDRERFSALLNRLDIRYPAHGFASSEEEAVKLAEDIGFPVLVRPSFVLGGRAMAIVYEKSELRQVIDEAAAVSPGAPVVIDRFLDGAIEFDVDALCDGEDVIIAGILQHIEEAGVHSGDSSAVLPPHAAKPERIEEMKAWTRQLAQELKVIGLMNIQFAVLDDELFVLEVNPRASRTVPFIAKAKGVPLAKIATKLMMGATLKELGITTDFEYQRYFVKAPVFPFRKFPGVDPMLTPEMKSTGEVMGISSSVGEAFAKAQLSAGSKIARISKTTTSRGDATENKADSVPPKVLLTIADRDKDRALPIATALHQAGYALAATPGTAALLKASGLEAQVLKRRHEGRPHCLDAIWNKEIALIINTPQGRAARKDGYAMRQAAIQTGTPLITTVEAAEMVIEAVQSEKQEPEVMPLQAFEL